LPGDTPAIDLENNSITIPVASPDFNTMREQYLMTLLGQLVILANQDEEEVTNFQKALTQKDSLDARASADEKAKVAESYAEAKQGLDEFLDQSIVGNPDEIDFSLADTIRVAHAMDVYSPFGGKAGYDAVRAKYDSMTYEGDMLINTEKPGSDVEDESDPTDIKKKIKKAITGSDQSKKESSVDSKGGLSFTGKLLLGGSALWAFLAYPLRIVNSVLGRGLLKIQNWGAKFLGGIGIKLDEEKYQSPKAELLEGGKATKKRMRGKR